MEDVKRIGSDGNSVSCFLYYIPKEHILHSAVFFQAHLYLESYFKRREDHADLISYHGPNNRRLNV